MSAGSHKLSRRERQIMDIVYERSEASARDIHSALPDAPSYSAVRALLAILVEKQQLAFEQRGARYIYTPTEPLSRVRESALKRLIKTFFGGSAAGAANALLGLDAQSLEDAELDELSRLIDEERARRR